MKMDKPTPPDKRSFLVHKNELSALERLKFREFLKQNYGIIVRDGPNIGITIPERYT